MSKILKPKTLAIITITTIIIGFALSIISNIILFNDVPNSIKANQTFSNIISFITSVNLYIIIYLLIILKKKEKNMKTLNLILFIWLIISLIISIIGKLDSINQISSITLNITTNSKKFQMWFNLITNTLSMLLEIIMVYGILIKKKMPYKFLMILLISLTFISLIPDIISYSTYLNNEYLKYNPIVMIIFNLLSTINGVLKSCSFVLFLYLYGKSINERSLKNER